MKDKIEVPDDEVPKTKQDYYDLVSKLEGVSFPEWWINKYDKAKQI